MYKQDLLYNLFVALKKISPKIPRMQILRKLSPLRVPFTVPPVPPGGQKTFGRFLASISAQVWRNITKNTKNADFKKPEPPAAPPPRLLAPLASLVVKIIFGRFLASITAQVWRNITKIAKNVDFEKTVSPSCPPNYLPPWPPWPPGSQNYFWEISGIYHSSSLKKHHQNCKECRF